MPEPSLSEITNMAVDPERATGTPATVYDSKDLVRNLNQAAQYKAENDWRKYTSFLGNLKEVYKDLNEIAKQPVMTQDRDQLKERMAKIVKGIASDPHGFFGGGGKYQETLGELASLQSEATESKQNKLYDEAHRQYFYRNPELDTPENRQMIDGFINQKLGTRQPYLMKLPGLFDPSAIAGELNNIAKRDLQNENPTPDGQFIEKITGTEYDPVKYDQAAESFYNDADKRGIPLRDTLTKRYQAMPEDVKSKYGKEQDPVKSWYLDLMRGYRMQGNTKRDLQPNPGYLEKEKLAEDKRQANLANAREWAKINLDKDKIAGAKEDDILEADAVLGEVRDVIKNSKPIYRTNNDGSKETLYEIGDPNLLKEFGTIEKDGTTGMSADKILFNPAKNDLSLVYYKKDEEGNVIEEKGKEQVDKTVTVNPTQWMGQMVKRKFPNKEIGTVNNIVEATFGKYGRNLDRLSKEYKRVGEDQGGGSYLIKGKTYSEKELLNMGYTTDQIKSYKQ